MPETGEEDPIYISYYVTRAQLEEDVFWDVHSWSAGQEGLPSTQGVYILISVLYQC